MVKKKKGIEARMVKLSTKSQATDAHIGDEKQNGKRKKNKEKETESGSPIRLPRIIWSPITTRMDEMQMNWPVRYVIDELIDANT